MWPGNQPESISYAKCFLVSRCIIFFRIRTQITTLFLLCFFSYFNKLISIDKFYKIKQLEIFIYLLFLIMYMDISSSSVSSLHRSPSFSETACGGRESANLKIQHICRINPSNFGVHSRSDDFENNLSET